jgi:hypothetical protein
MIFSHQFYPFSYYSTAQIKIFARDLSDNGGSQNDILYLRPDATSDPYTVITEIPEKDLPFLTPDTFTGGMGEELLSEMTIQQLEIIGKKGGYFLKEAIKKAAKMAMLKGKPISRLKEYIDYCPAWQTEA